jgi:hypothetical protein
MNSDSLLEMVQVYDYVSNSVAYSLQGWKPSTVRPDSHLKISTLDSTVLNTEHEKCDNFMNSDSLLEMVQVYDYVSNSVAYSLQGWKPHSSQEPTYLKFSQLPLPFIHPCAAKHRHVEVSGKLSSQIRVSDAVCTWYDKHEYQRHIVSMTHRQQKIENNSSRKKLDCW